MEKNCPNAQIKINNFSGRDGTGKLIIKIVFSWPITHRALCVCVNSDPEIIAYHAIRYIFYQIFFLQGNGDFIIISNKCFNA